MQWYFAETPRERELDQRCKTLNEGIRHVNHGKEVLLSALELFGEKHVHRAKELLSSLKICMDQ